MRKIHDVLRLHFDLKLPRQIARSIQLRQSTVSEYLTRFQHSGLSWPLPDGYDGPRLQENVFGAAAEKRDALRAHDAGRGSFTRNAMA
jgi:hypothetical protein